MQLTVSSISILALSVGVDHLGTAAMWLTTFPDWTQLIHSSFLTPPTQVPLVEGKVPAFRDPGVTVRGRLSPNIMEPGSCRRTFYWKGLPWLSRTLRDCFSEGEGTSVLAGNTPDDRVYVPASIKLFCNSVFGSGSCLFSIGLPMTGIFQWWIDVD